MMLEFGEWLPDLPVFNNPGVTEAKNVLPGTLSYEPALSLSAYATNALTARCQGAAYGVDDGGNTYNFAGDATKLYKRSVTTDTDVSKVGGYATAADGTWSFAKYNRRVIATNFIDNMQSFIIGSSSVFADLAISAPRAYCVALQDNFVLAGNTYDSIDGAVPHRVRNSAIGDPTDWTVSAATQADFVDLDGDKGWVKNIVSGEYALIFQERAITRMEYAGSPTIFQMRVIDQNRGLLTQNAVTQVGSLVFYLAYDGFYLCDGTQSVPIGDGKVNKTFFDDLDLSYVHMISCAKHPELPIICWAYPGDGHSGGIPNKIICYNYSPNAKMRWSYFMQDVEFLVPALAEGYTLDTLDSINTSIDALPYSLDSRFYTGKYLVFAAYNSSHTYSTFTGSALAALIETQEGQPFQGRLGDVDKVRPIVDGSGTITVQVGTRDVLTESVTWSTASSMNTTGECDVRANSRYIRGRVNITGGFNHAQGIEIESARPSGNR